MGCQSLGLWTVPAFDAANFSAGGSMTWTVEPADVFTWAYVRLGGTVIASVVMMNTQTGGTASNELRIAMPPGLTVARNGVAMIRLRESGTPTMGYFNVRANLPYIAVIKQDGTNFALSSAVDVLGQIAFEVL